MPGLKKFFPILLACGRICTMFFPALVSWNAVWLPSLGMTCFLFVCLFFFLLPLFLNRSACDKFNADGFTFNHSEQKKYQSLGYAGRPVP